MVSLLHQQHYITVAKPTNTYVDEVAHVIERVALRPRALEAVRAVPRDDVRPHDAEVPRGALHVGQGRHLHVGAPVRADEDQVAVFPVLERPNGVGHPLRHDAGVLLLLNVCVWIEVVCLEAQSIHIEALHSTHQVHIRHPGPVAGGGKLRWVVREADDADLDALMLQDDGAACLLEGAPGARHLDAPGLEVVKCVDQPLLAIVECVVVGCRMV